MTKLDRVLVALVVVTCMVLASPAKAHAGGIMDILWWVIGH